MFLNEYLQIPERCILNNRIHKKVVLENAELSSTERRLIREQVETMTWLAAIKPTNSNIPAFSDDLFVFDEVHWIVVTLRNPDKVKRIAGLLQKVIPYPLILVFMGERQLALNLAEKRINLNDSSKRTVEKSETTSWFGPSEDLGGSFLKSLAFPQLSKTSLRSHFEDIQRRFTSFFAGELTGTFVLKPAELRALTVELLEKVRNLEDQMTSIRAAIKKETQFNRKVDLNVQLKKLEQDKLAIASQL